MGKVPSINIVEGNRGGGVVSKQYAYPSIV